MDGFLLSGVLMSFLAFRFVYLMVVYMVQCLNLPPCGGERDVKFPEPPQITPHTHGQKIKKITKRENPWFSGKTRLFPYDHG